MEKKTTGEPHQDNGELPQRHNKKVDDLEDNLQLRTV